MVNLSKSSCYLPSHDNGSLRKSIGHLLRMESMDVGETYLGMLLFWGRHKVKWFSFLCDKVSSTINLWDSSSLSQAGRTWLIQSVTNTMANFLTSTFWLPDKIRKKLRNEQSKFWWGKTSNTFLRTISWKTVCKHKHEGDLGIRGASLMNTSLLTKLAWRILSNPSYLVARVLKARYENGLG